MGTVLSTIKELVDNEVTIRKMNRWFIKWSSNDNSS